MKSTWRFVVKIVGVSLALAGVICLFIGFWESLEDGGERIVEKVRGKCRRYCPEFDDYDDDLLYE
ncbi:MAG: hypothetical protein HFF79_03335 [Oscillospiraceae bacterium]|nr:hypothetical protein [Oscillospiraceae bacterium]MCI8878451.1 hypothetical protein [Oscillospiraceae bacterium]